MVASSHLWILSTYTYGLSCGPVVKNPPAVQETQVQSLDWEDPLEEEMATSVQYSCQENPMDGGAWWATVHNVTESPI